jgi:hypothetical protein
VETFTVVTFTRLAEEEKDSMETVTAVNFNDREDIFNIKLIISVKFDLQLKLLNVFILGQRLTVNIDSLFFNKIDHIKPADNIILITMSGNLL